jgi:hypothetical protein
MANEFEFDYPGTAQNFHSFMKQLIFKYGKTWESESGKLSLRFDLNLQNTYETVWHIETFTPIVDGKRGAPEGSATILAFQLPDTDRTKVKFEDGLTVISGGLAPERKTCDPIGPALSEFVNFVKGEVANFNSLDRLSGEGGKHSKADVSEELDHLRNLRSKYKKNLWQVEEQIADHGGEMRAPVDLRNQKESFEEEIDKITLQIEELEKGDG